MLETLIARFGYPALFVGTFLEGETVLVLAGFAAHRGYLSLPWVIACAFLGSLGGDQTAFLLGRRYGSRWLAARPSWARRVSKVLAFLERFPTLTILGFRFLYGVRTVTPFAIGTSSVPAARFAWLNAIAAAVWAAAFGAGGYLFGHALEALLGEMRHYELQAFAAIALVGATLWLIHLWRARRPA